MDDHPFSRLKRAADLVAEPPDPRAARPEGSGDRARWSLPTLAGSLTELSGAGGAPSLTLASLLVAEAHRRGIPAVWISATPDLFFPPDMAENGVQLPALPVVRAPGATAALQAAVWLARSGAFGLIVADLGGARAVPAALQGRLAQLARRHLITVLFLTDKEPGEPSLGSLIAVHGRAERRGLPSSRHSCSVRMVKDKRRGPGWRCMEEFRGPAGLR